MPGDDRLRSLVRRVRRREDLTTAPREATTGDEVLDDPPRVDPVGESGQPPEEPRTPKGSDGVPYHPDDPRFPDVWGNHPRSPFGRLIR
jgi:hypothetical protein